ncbi:MAG: hypothetical protein U9O90_09575 [Euryarchaeota archaeon]|nr:hypothetical protein [Euryarchaeota archaeon]
MDACPYVAKILRPVFRRMEIRKPNYVDMQRVKGVLEDSGLRCVICQTEFGINGSLISSTNGKKLVKI